MGTIKGRKARYAHALVEKAPPSPRATASFPRPAGANWCSVSDALRPTRRNRQCDRAKKPIKNTFEVKKRGARYTSGHVDYTLKVTKLPPPPAQTR
jgi:hypothetical protein